MKSSSNMYSSFFSMFFPKINDEETVSPFNTLPDELILNVFSFLSAKELCGNSLVCKKWKEISEDEHLWKNLELFKKEGFDDVEDFEVTDKPQDRCKKDIDNLFKSLQSHTHALTNPKGFSSREYGQLGKELGTINLNSEQGQMLFIILLNNANNIVNNINIKTGNKYPNQKYLKEIFENIQIDNQEDRISFLNLFARNYRFDYNLPNSSHLFLLLNKFEIKDEQEISKFLQIYATREPSDFCLGLCWNKNTSAEGIIYDLIKEIVQNNDKLEKSTYHYIMNNHWVNYKTEQHKELQTILIEKHINKNHDLLLNYLLNEIVKLQDFTLIKAFSDFITLDKPLFLLELVDLLLAEGNTSVANQAADAISDKAMQEKAFIKIKNYRNKNPSPKIKRIDNVDARQAYFDSYLYE